MGEGPDNPYAYQDPREPDGRGEQSDEYELDLPEEDAPAQPGQALEGEVEDGPSTRYTHAPGGAALPPGATAVRCPTCGYDLSGTMVGGACPECGTPVRAAFDRATAPRRTNGLSITSMVLGILALVPCLCAWPLGPILGITAIIFAYYGRRASQRLGRAANDDAMALTGLICGGLSVTVTLIGLLIWTINALTP